MLERNLMLDLETGFKNITSDRTAFLEAQDVNEADSAAAQSLRRFKTTSNTLTEATKSFLSEVEAVAQFNSTHAVISATTQKIMQAYIDKQKELKTEGYRRMTVPLLIERLLTNRPIVYFKDGFGYLYCSLQDGTVVKKKTAKEIIEVLRTLGDGKKHLWLTPDEMMLGSLLVTSGATYYINKGDRENNGLPAETHDFHKRGIFTGLVGARLESKGESEFPLFVTSPGDKGFTDEEHCLYSIMAKEFGGGLSYEKTEEDAKANPKNYIRICEGVVPSEVIEGLETITLKNPKFVSGGTHYFNKQAYKNWLRAIIEPELLSKNELAGLMQIKETIRANGIGLGVWALCDEVKLIQAELLIEVYQEVIAKYELVNIAAIDFANLVYGQTTYGKFSPDTLKEFTDKRDNKIAATISSNNFASKSQAKEEFIASQYPWDSNSFVGNEHWLTLTSGSMDPAAASCSGIIESQNPLINKLFPKRSFVIEKGKMLPLSDGHSLEQIALNMAIGLELNEEKIEALDPDVLKKLQESMRITQQTELCNAITTSEKQAYDNLVVKLLPPGLPTVDFETLFATREPFVGAFVMYYLLNSAYTTKWLCDAKDTLIPAAEKNPKADEALTGQGIAQLYAYLTDTEEADPNFKSTTLKELVSLLVKKIEGIKEEQDIRHLFTVSFGLRHNDAIASTIFNRITNSAIESKEKILEYFEKSENPLHIIFVMKYLCERFPTYLNEDHIKAISKHSEVPIKGKGIPELHHLLTGESQDHAIEIKLGDLAKLFLSKAKQATEQLATPTPPKEATATAPAPATATASTPPTIPSNGLHLKALLLGVSLGGALGFAGLCYKLSSTDFKLSDTTLEILPTAIKFIIPPALLLGVVGYCYSSFNSPSKGHEIK